MSNTDAPETIAAESEAPVRPDWALVLHVGPAPAASESGARVVDVTPASSSVEDVLSVLSKNGLSPADMLTRALFVVDPAPQYRDVAVAVYAALCGFAGRRLDARVGDVELPLSSFHHQMVGYPDAGRAPYPVEQAQIGAERDDMQSIVLGESVNAAQVTLIRAAKRLRLVLAQGTDDALAQVVLVGALRSRDGLDRFPMVVAGDEPLELPVLEGGIVGSVGLCLHEMRRGAERLRRSNRGDTRDALAPVKELSNRQKRLVSAADIPLEDTLARLNVRHSVLQVDEGDGSSTADVAYHCPKPENHTNGDQTPSAQIYVGPDGKRGFQCHRCLPTERVDSLRLVMWAKDLSVDEAGDWLLNA